MIRFLECDSYIGFDHTTSGICILDVSGKVISVNGVFEELFGLRSMEVVGKRENFLPHVPMELRFQANRYLKQSLTEYKSVQFRTVRKGKNNIEMYVDVKISPFTGYREMTNGLLCEYRFNSVYVPGSKLSDYCSS